MFSHSKTLALGLTASALIFTACGKQSEEAAGVTIPDAPDAAIQTVITEFAEGNGGIIWQAMPATYQTDLNGLVQLAGTKLDAEVYDKSFATIGRLAAVVEKQQAFILGCSFLEGRTAEEMAQLEAALPSVVGIVNTLTSSELASTAGLASFDGQAFFDTTVSKFASYSDELAKLAGEESMLSDYANTVVSIVEADDSSATLLTTITGQEPVEQDFTKVEGRWVPAEMASEWAANIAEATANIEATTGEEMAAQKPQIMGVLTMLDGVLSQIEAAETQEQFDQSLQGAMMPLIMMMGQGMGGMGAPAAPMPAAPSSMPSQ